MEKSREWRRFPPLRLQMNHPNFILDGRTPDEPAPRLASLTAERRLVRRAAPGDRYNFRPPRCSMFNVKSGNQSVFDQQTRTAGLPRYFTKAKALQMILLATSRSLIIPGIPGSLSCGSAPRPHGGQLESSVAFPTEKPAIVIGVLRCRSVDPVRARIPVTLVGAIWNDGSFLFSNDMKNGDFPFFFKRIRSEAAHVSIERVQKAVAPLQRVRKSYGCLARPTKMIFVRVGNEWTQLSSWHEIAEEGGEFQATALGVERRLNVPESSHGDSQAGSDYRRFREVWDDVHAILSDADRSEARQVETELLDPWFQKFLSDKITPKGK